MFTITDEDRKLREEGEAWRKQCELNLVLGLTGLPQLGTDKSRREAILRASFEETLRDRTALLRRIYRLSERDDAPRVWVTVSQRAVDEALAGTRMKVMSEQNVRKLIHRYISDDFEVSHLHVNFQGGPGLTVHGYYYTSFSLTIKV